MLSIYGKDGFFDTTAILEAAVTCQALNDKRTGTCGLGDASWLSFETKGEWEEFLPAEDQLQLVAICSLVNTLQDMADLIVKANAEHHLPSENDCEAMGGDPDLTEGY